MRTLTDISIKNRARVERKIERLKAREKKAEQRRFNKSVDWLINNIKKGCKKSAKRGLFQYELYVPDFRKNHKEFALGDMIFCVQVIYLEKAKIKMTSNGEDTLIFKWDKEVSQ